MRHLIDVVRSTTATPLDHGLQQVAAYALTNPASFVTATSRDRFGGSAWRHARLWLAEYANGLCVLCGESGDALGKPRAAGTLEAGHLLPLVLLDSACGWDGGDRLRTGYIAPNLGAMHAECNKGAGERILTAADLARPDLVPLSWPGFHKYGVTASPRG